MADRFLIANELGIAKSGIYMLAAQLATIIWLFFDAANKAFLPWLYEKLSRNELKEKIYIVKMTYAWFGQTKHKSFLQCISFLLIHCD